MTRQIKRTTRSLRNRVFTFVGLLVLVSLVGSGWTLVRVSGVNQVLDGLKRSWLATGRELGRIQNDSESLKSELDRSLGYRHWADLVEQGVSARHFSSPDWAFQALDGSFESALSQLEGVGSGEIAPLVADYRRSLNELRTELKVVEADTESMARLLDTHKWAEAQRAYSEWNRRTVQWTHSVETVVGDWEKVSKQVLDQTQRKIEVLRTGLRLSLFSAVLLSLLLLWLAERALRPLGHLSMLAREITRRGLERKDKELLSEFPLHRSDEVSLLARDFHSMASSLLERERVVSEQTRQLEEQNRQLREVHRLRERLREAESLAAIGRLSAQVAHEVRNPLHAIGLEAELAIEKVQALGDTQLKQSLQSILEAVERLSQITDNYLKFSKPSQGVAVRFDLGEALDSVLATYASECEKLGIRVDWSRPASPSLLEVLADRSAVEQALGNLMRNSIQALECTERSGEGSDRIAWSLGMAESGRVWIRIRDNGPGISPAIRDRLFAPFSTTKAQGTGLGLSWVKRVIEEQGGQVELLENGEGQSGACFSVVFPRAPERMTAATSLPATLSVELEERI